MSETLKLTPKILEIANSNDIYMTIELVILTNQVNYNGALFTDNFIDGVINNKERYIGIPLVANRVKLEGGEYDDLNHELKDGQLQTDIIGSFVDFWKETDEDESILLKGSARVLKRYPNTCNALLELFETGDLEFSVEVAVRNYTSVEDGVRQVDYNDGNNALLASCVVTEGAEVKSKATLLIAQAIKKDLDSIEDLSMKGDENMSKDNIEIAFNKGKEIRYHGELETSSLRFNEVANLLYNALNPIDAKTGDRTYNFYIADIYNDHVICESWNDYDKLYRVPYTVSGENVILSDKTEWQEGSWGFVPKGIIVNELQEKYTTEINQLRSEYDEKVTELNNKINELETAKGELSNMEKTVEELNTEIASLQAKVTELEGTIAELNTKVTDSDEKVAELNSTIVNQEEVKKELESTITELNSKVEELTPYKEEVETAKKESKMNELSSKFSKLISEDVMKSERVQTALTELNEIELNSIVVEEIAKAKEVEVASKIEEEEDVVTTAKKQADLLPEDLSSKYGLSL